MSCSSGHIFTPLVLHKIMGSLDIILSQEDSQGGGQSPNVKAQSHTHSHTTNNLEMLNSLQSMSLDWAKKPEHPEETSKARLKACKHSHTGQKWKVNLNPGAAGH